MADFKICKNKVTFSTFEDAHTFLKGIGRIRQQRPYKCPICLYFHNTSLNAEGRRKIRELYSEKRKANTP